MDRSRLAKNGDSGTLAHPREPGNPEPIRDTSHEEAIPALLLSTDAGPESHRAGDRFQSTAAAYAPFAERYMRRDRLLICRSNEGLQAARSAEFLRLFLRWLRPSHAACVHALPRGFRV